MSFRPGVREGMEVSPNEERLRLGINFIEGVWSEMALKIVEKAVEVYQLSSEEAGALRVAFLRRTLVRFEAV